jgi:hypothetical protein
MRLGRVRRKWRGDEVVIGLDDDERVAVADAHGQVGTAEGAILPPRDPCDAGEAQERIGPLRTSSGRRVAEFEIKHRGTAVLHC